MVILGDIEDNETAEGEAPCSHCGGSGFNPITNGICTCRTESNFQQYAFKDTDNIFIPGAYKGVRFNKNLVDRTMPEHYAPFLDNLIKDITSGRWVNQNLLICSPTGTSKTIMSYTAMDYLSCSQVPTAPLLDLFEVKAGLLDIYRRKIPVHNIEVDLLFEVPYLFVSIPLDINQSVLNTVETLISRRIRCNGATVFIHNGDFRNLQQFDKANLLQGMLGDGSFKSLRVESFWRNR